MRDKIGMLIVHVYTERRETPLGVFENVCSHATC